jgi:hypothetical protein
MVPNLLEQRQFQIRRAELTIAAMMFASDVTIFSRAE